MQHQVLLYPCTGALMPVFKLGYPILYANWAYVLYVYTWSDALYLYASQSVPVYIYMPKCFYTHMKAGMLDVLARVLPYLYSSQDVRIVAFTHIIFHCLYLVICDQFSLVMCSDYVTSHHWLASSPNYTGALNEALLNHGLKMLLSTWNVLISHQILKILANNFVTLFWNSQPALPKTPSQLVNFGQPELTFPNEIQILICVYYTL